MATQEQTVRIPRAGTRPRARQHVLPACRVSGFLVFRTPISVLPAASGVTQYKTKKTSSPRPSAPLLLSQGFILLTKLFSQALEMDWAGEEECGLGPFVRSGLCPHRLLPATRPVLSRTAHCESEFGSPHTLEIWKGGYFSRLEEDEKLAGPTCCWFLEVRSEVQRLFKYFSL